MAHLCTYVYRVNGESVNANATTEESQSILQSYLGNEHEVISIDSMNLNTIRNADSNSQVIHHVIKIRTHDPEYVAMKLMGDAWVREDHILFKAIAR